MRYHIIIGVALTCSLSLAITEAQVITTVAGTTFTFPSQLPPAANAPFGPTGGLATDAQGNVYAVDLGNSLVVRISPDGTLSIVAGNGTGGFSGDGGPATSAALAGPYGVALDGAGNIYISDTSNFRVRRVSGGVITTIAGNGTQGYSGDGGPATSATLSLGGLAVDSAGNVYIADTSHHCIRRVSGGIVTTIAGNGSPGFSGDGGPATSAMLFAPFGVAVDSAGNVYIADSFNDRIRRVSNGIITTIVGEGLSFSVDGRPATSIELAFPVSVAVDSTGNIYFDDYNRVLKLSGGSITTIAGGFSSGFSGDGGPAVSATLSSPEGVAVDSAGNVYVADSDNSRIRRVSAGIITTIGGNGTFKFSGDGGPATTAALQAPSNVAIDQAGNLFIADTQNNRIRRVSGGIITTIAGNGIAGFSGDGGPATNAKLSGPSGIAVDPLSATRTRHYRSSAFRTETGRPPGNRGTRAQIQSLPWTRIHRDSLDRQNRRPLPYWQARLQLCFRVDRWAPPHWPRDRLRRATSY